MWLYANCDMIFRQVETSLDVLAPTGKAFRIGNTILEFSVNCLLNAAHWLDQILNHAHISRDQLACSMVVWDLNLATFCCKLTLPL